MVLPAISRAPAASDVEEAGQEAVARTILGESTMWGVLGYRRMFKSTLAALFCAQMRLKGVRILHIGNLTFGEVVDPVMLASQDPRDLGECLLFIDEVGEVIRASRSASAYQILLQSNLRQSGHQGLSIIWTTQFERGLPSQLTEQADWIYYVTGARKRRWTTDRAIETGRVAAQDDNRCDAWKPDSPYHWKHAGRSLTAAEQKHFGFQNREIAADCRTTEQKCTVFYDCVAQYGNPVGVGRRESRILHCAQRYFPLLSTRYKVDAMGPLMLTVDTLREQQEMADLDRIRTALEEAGAKGIGSVPPAAIGDYLYENLKLDLTPTKLGRTLDYLGVPRKKTNKGRRYNLKEWLETRDDDEDDLKTE